MYLYGYAFISLCVCAYASTHANKPLLTSALTFLPRFDQTSDKASQRSSLLQTGCWASDPLTSLECTRAYKCMQIQANNFRPFPVGENEDDWEIQSHTREANGIDFHIY